MAENKKNNVQETQESTDEMTLEEFKAQIKSINCEE